MKIGSLFSGYGGLDLAVSAVTGAEELGIELIKVDGVYYTVRNLHVSDGLNNNIILETDLATERHSPASIIKGK